MTTKMNISMEDLFKGGSPLSLKTIIARTGLNRKEARYFVQDKLRSGQLRRVNPMEVGSGKYKGNPINSHRSKDEKKKLRKDRNGSFNRSWKTGLINVFALV